jgi:SAP domain-containing protein/uncharacterized protein DUF6434
VIKSLTQDDQRSQKRPKHLTASININDLRNFYWWKEELVRFCISQGIPATGRKLDILKRIETFLRTGKVLRHKQPVLGAAGKRPDQPITLASPVVNFKSDQRTREFFQKVIGPEFHFTAYLNTFMRGRNDLTYGDLVKEWQAERERRKDKSYRPPIMKSCEYNQFIRDYFADAANRGKTMRDAVGLWKRVRGKHGPRKYAPEDRKE